MVWNSIIVIIIGTSIPVLVIGWRCGQVGACIVFVGYPIVVAIIPTSVSVCIVVWRCRHVRARIVVVQHPVVIVVVVGSGIPVNPFHDERKADRIPVEAGAPRFTPRLYESGDDVHVEIGHALEVALRNVDSNHGFVGWRKRRRVVGVNDIGIEFSWCKLTFSQFVR